MNNKLDIHVIDRRNGKIISTNIRFNLGSWFYTGISKISTLSVKFFIKIRMYLFNYPAILKISNPKHGNSLKYSMPVFVGNAIPDTSQYNNYTLPFFGSSSKLRFCISST